MDDIVHVEIEVVKLVAIGVWLGNVNGNFFAMDDIGLFFDDFGYDFGVLGG